MCIGGWGVCVVGVGGVCSGGWGMCGGGWGVCVVGVQSPHMSYCEL